MLLRRGSALDALGELERARTELERALLLATGAKSTYQEVRTELALSSVTASEGRVKMSETMAAAAVKEAESQRARHRGGDGLVNLPRH